MPDFKWLEDVMPQNEKWSEFSRKLVEVGGLVKDVIEIGKHFLCLIIFKWAPLRFMCINALVLFILFEILLFIYLF